MKSKRPQIWAALRSMDDFTLCALAAASGAARDTVRRYVAALERGGYVMRTGASHKRESGYLTPFFRLTTDPGSEAPHLRHDGSPVQSHTHTGAVRENLWRSMQLLGQFTIPQLLDHATTDTTRPDEYDTRQYLHWLARAGLIIRQTGQKPAPGRPVTFLFNEAGFTGPKPPRVRRGGTVYDPNTDRVVYQPTQQTGENIQESHTTWFQSSASSHAVTSGRRHSL